MQLTLVLLLQHWPGLFGLCSEQILADPMCGFVLGSCGNAGREKLHLNECADSGLVIDGHQLTRSGDWYEWVKV